MDLKEENMSQSIPLDVHAESWLPVPMGSDFPLANLPLGIFSSPGKAQPRAGTALGDQIIDLSVLEAAGLLRELQLPANSFSQTSLNNLLAHGKQTLQQLRSRLQALFAKEATEIKNNTALHRALLVSQSTAKMELPVKVGDYTDFYSSIEHATNVGSLFRDPSNPLLPNWRHLPVGYHGRASSIQVSGKAVRRPIGQRKPPTAEAPLFGPSTQLDFELEVAFITCGQTQLGERISTGQAADYIAGFVLFNDWSARDIQAWEYVPLGPFLGKNFASSISPWLISLEALEPFRTQGPPQEPEPLPYLRRTHPMNFDVHLQAHLKPKEIESQLITSTNFKYMYWDVAQQLAHHTIGGCNINPGDMYASGTISGSAPDSYGSMLELSWRGQRPLQLTEAVQRAFLEDGDSLRISGHAERDGLRIGFGEVVAEILPALPYDEP